jgi:hypothetical protein
VIVEPKHAKALHSQKRIAPSVASEMLGLEVLAAVDLNDQVGGPTDKIHDVRTNRRLPLETRACKPVSPYCMPNNSLRIG